MRRSRRSAALCAAALLLLSPAVAGSADGTPAAGPAPAAARNHHASAAERAAVRVLRADRAGTVLAGRDGSGTGEGTTPSIYDGTSFMAPDGLYYERSPLLVPGNNGTVYFGEEMDIACAVGHRYSAYLKALAKLAKTISGSGRTVVFTAAPNKSAVNKGDLPAQLPHEYCDRNGIAEQDHALDTFHNRGYLQVRRKLQARSAKGVPLYWHIDTHWTTMATSSYADALARRLKPQLARIQSFRTGEETILVDLSYLGVIGDTYETLPAHYSTTRVKVRPAHGSPAYDDSVMIDPDLSWSTGPSQRTWPGRTLLIGDSFTYRGLNNLMPLFRHGRFLWTGNVPVQRLLDGIADSSTVVLEVVQRYLPFSLLIQPQFREAVRQAIAAHDRAAGR